MTNQPANTPAVNKENPANLKDPKNPTPTEASNNEACSTKDANAADGNKKEESCSTSEKPSEKKAAA